jgi:pyoverdine/dityrosine biosynthesis protein Dit1
MSKKKNQSNFLEDSNSMGIKILIHCHPPNSPDFNALDFGFLYDPALPATQVGKKH